MGLKLQSAIDTAVTILNDHGFVAYSPEDLLRYANDALKTIAPSRPELFETRGEVTCVAGETVQEVSYDGALGLVSVDRIKNGRALTRTTRKAMDAWDPLWQTKQAAAAKQWMPHATSPIRFLIDAPAPANQVLEVTYVAPPPDYTADTDTGLPDALAPVVTDYVVGTAMARDDEHINAGRAQAFLASFAARIKGAV